MLIYLGNKKIQSINNKHQIKYIKEEIPEVDNIILITSDNYTLKDIDDSYITVQSNIMLMTSDYRLLTDIQGSRLILKEDK